MKNPLIDLLRDIFSESLSAVSEFELMRLLEEAGAFAGMNSQNEGDLALFQRHFVLMNALYQLQVEAEENNDCLTISPLEIQLTRKRFSVERSVEKPLAADNTENKLREYYLDWENFEATNANDVADLLNGFWQKFWQVDEKQEACEVLGLTVHASESEIKKRYQVLVSEHHPDKGGDSEEFIKIRRAYEALLIG